MITQNELKELLHYDPETGVFTHINARKKVRVGEVAGCLCKVSGYIYIMLHQKNYRAHRLAWLYVYGQFPPDCLDHINRSRSDNRIANLRMSTRPENQQNMSRPKNNKSGHTGVCWSPRYEKWAVSIGMNKKTIYLGRFEELADAVAARTDAKARLHTFNPVQTTENQAAW